MKIDGHFRIVNGADETVGFACIDCHYQLQVGHDREGKTARALDYCPKCGNNVEREVYALNGPDALSKEEASK